ncbi:hypothetical protein ACSCBZ_46175 [Streptomyces niveiscabiei]|uniref:hypothetical protein n=1 Tax=Streptomyces niveiscabiei TaxID=164115 RepID=UPI00131AC908|nr:hypothetical protein [Streptomyces niveiscabiei]
MSDDGEIAGTPDPAAVRQPLPPEVPMQRAPVEPEMDPAPAADGTADDWWRAAAPLPPAAPPMPPHRPGSDWALEAGRPDQGEGGDPAGTFWQGDQVRGEMRDTWATHGQEGIAAAVEIGEYISDAITSRLPDPHAPGAKPKADLRWLRLKYNVPAILISLLVTWRSHTSVDRMTAWISEDGIFAPLGAVLIFALLLGLLMVLPIGSWLASAFSDLISWLVIALIRLFGKAWSTPVIGYVMRLIVAVALWSFAISVVRAVWRGAVHFLTGA